MVDDLSHDGRGVLHIDGKAVFVADCLPGESVRFQYFRRTRRADEGRLLEVLQASVDRVEPECAHFGRCGGCSLQHLDCDAQIRAKEHVLRENLTRIGGVEPANWLVPLRGAVWGYRRKARLSVRYVHKKERLLVGFRERDGRFVADINRCPVLEPVFGERLEEISTLLAQLSTFRRIPQVEIAVGDDSAAMVIRHLDELNGDDMRVLRDFERQSGIRVLLQPGGVDSVHPVSSGKGYLKSALPEFDVDYEFLPTDFVQVNREINAAMVSQALELLAPQPDSRAVDLFCGLGNFTLPLARRCAEVVGVEGDPLLIHRAESNALRQGIKNARFFVDDLQRGVNSSQWTRGRFDLMLLDPPRSGAAEVLPLVKRLGVGTVLYVSCHPATLARDAALLVDSLGFQLHSAGVMDMFPHTGHVESMALFVNGDHHGLGV